MQRLRIQYASGFFLEKTGPVAFSHLIRPVAPVLVLAGGIGSPHLPGSAEFVTWASRLWRHVIVLGPCAKPRLSGVHYLDETMAVDIGKFRFINGNIPTGCLLDTVAVCTEDAMTAVIVSFEQPPVIAEWIQPAVSVWITGQRHRALTSPSLCANQWGRPGYCREIFHDLITKSGGCTSDPLLRAAGGVPLLEEFACAPPPQRLA